jgi:hypothetical protein
MRGKITRLSIVTMVHRTNNHDASGMEDSPGPPSRVFKWNSWSTVLWILVLLAASVAAQAIAADYWAQREAKPASRPALVRHPWLDSRAAVTALVGLLGLAVARANLALGLRPYLSYSNLGPKSGDTSPQYSVLLRNEGTGPAIIVGLKYKLRKQGEQWESILEHETVVQRVLDHCGLKEGSDYKLARFSSGATIGKDKDRTVLEVKNESIERLLKLSNFDIEVQFEGLLGDVYQKTIHCLPRAEYQRPKRVAQANAGSERPG